MKRGGISSLHTSGYNRSTVCYLDYYHFPSFLSWKHSGNTTGPATQQAQVALISKLLLSLCLSALFPPLYVCKRMHDITALGLFSHTCNTLSFLTDLKLGLKDTKASINPTDPDVSAWVSDQNDSVWSATSASHPSVASLSHGSSTVHDPAPTLPIIRSDKSFRRFFFSVGSRLEKCVFWPIFKTVGISMRMLKEVIQ